LFSFDVVHINFMNRSKYELLEPYTRETPKFP
jgi:hypothetical protein